MWRHWRISSIDYTLPCRFVAPRPPIGFLMHMYKLIAGSQRQCEWPFAPRVSTTYRHPSSSAGMYYMVLCNVGMCPPTFPKPIAPMKKPNYVIVVGFNRCVSHLHCALPNPRTLILPHILAFFPQRFYQHPFIHLPARDAVSFLFLGRPHIRMW